MTKKLTIEQLERRVERLEKRVEKLEAERDEAREDAIILRTFDIIRRHNLYRRFGTYLTSEQIRLIRLEQMTVEQAVAERNERWPILSYGDDSGLTLEQAYEMAK